MKNEENEPNPEIKSELHEIGCSEEDFAECDTESIVAHSPAGATEITVSPALTNPTTSEEERYFCDYCGKGFRQKSYLASHMTAHMNKIERRVKTFRCTTDGCTEVCKSKYLFNKHRLTVHNIKPVSRDPNAPKQKFCCQKCPKWFTEQYKLDGHIRSKHEGLKV